ncbi:hypothetical protein ANANG_G00170250 [Anguilla anguilla]|uniref:Activin types I and II receptor domain-containing protein n=1 Tax=Anguilla anguilla TaxID=7936 RepID=A0A9D3M6P5_ANGAN|nr:hypothetical protein ANANG_G00170250 [Anguilla anguilla]
MSFWVEDGGQVPVAAFGKALSASSGGPALPSPWRLARRRTAPVGNNSGRTRDVGLQCHCQRCPNSTCVTDGLCYVFMNKSGGKYTQGFGMCLKESDLYPPDRPFVCAASTKDNTGIYPLCCDTDFCNKDPDLSDFIGDLSQHALGKT